MALPKHGAEHGAVELVDELLEKFDVERDGKATSHPMRDRKYYTYRLVFDVVGIVPDWAIERSHYLGENYHGQEKRVIISSFKDGTVVAIADTGSIN